MRLINFKSLTIRNFLSVGTTPVVIDFQSGVNIITGNNLDKEDSKNGVGKSTIVDALYFALFGQTIREINKDLIINSSAKKNCEVSIAFQVIHGPNIATYSITRTLAPTKCYITKDGVDITHSTLAKTNEHIHSLIRSTGKVFQNSVIMSINNTVPFMAQSKIDKRKFIENVLNLEVFSEMLSQARDEHNNLKRDYEVLYSKNQTIEKSLTFNKQQLDLFQTNKQEKISGIENKIAKATTAIATLTGEFVNLPDDINSKINDKVTALNFDLESLNAEHRVHFGKKTEIQTKINLLLSEFKNIESVGAICKTCNRPYPEDDISHKENTKKSIQEQIDTLTLNKTDVNIKLSEWDTLITSKKNDIKELDVKKTSIQKILIDDKNKRERVNLLQDSYNDLLNEKEEITKLTNEDLEKNVITLDTEFNTNSISLSSLDKNLSVLECVKFVVAEEGVKSYIVKKILKVLNSRLSYYLKELHANCTCIFNEYFDEQITDEKGDEKSYFNFSGGERKRIDLACLFAFLDIRRMQGDVHFSTIFYDELLDSSLDDKGVELVLKVLKNRKETYNENCYIITHRTNAISDKIDNTVTLEKRNGFTTLI